MKLFAVGDSTGGARVAAGVIAERLHRVASPVLGVATGESPRLVYGHLAELRDAETFATDKLSAVALDEYVGLAPGDPDGYQFYVRREVGDRLTVPADRLLVPPGWRADLEEACREFEAGIRALGGVDVQLLGIGRNGHIGFNEPGSALDSRTRSVRLAEETRRDNAPHFSPGRTVPDSALTQGIGTILEARRLVLLAFGPAKADALAAALEGPIGPDCPASAIRLHPDVVVVADPGAMALLSPSIVATSTLAS